MSDVETQAALGQGALQRIVDGLGAELGDQLLSSVQERGDLWVRIDRRAWHRAAEVCKGLGLTYFCFLSGLDWQLAPDLSGEKTFEGEEPVPEDVDDEADAAAAGADDTAVAEDVGATDALATGVAGGASRFQVFARLYDVDRKVGVTLKADLGDDLAVATLTDVYRGADWHERETWEMFGFEFVDHPGIRHLYLPGEFEGHPLRKDFPLLAREVKPWPGLVDVEPMPGGDEPAAETEEPPV